MRYRMKKYIIFAILIFFAVNGSSSELQMDVFDLDNNYLGWDQYAVHKNASYSSGRDNFPITYYIFSAGRYLERQIISKSKISAKDNAGSKFISGHSQDSDFESDNYMAEDKPAYSEPDHLYQGMIVIDYKGNCVYFRSEEVLPDNPEQKREVKVQWVPEKKGYIFTIWDPNSLESEQLEKGFIDTGHMMPVLSAFPFLFDIFSIASEAEEGDKVEFIDPYHLKMIIITKSMATRDSLTLDKETVQEPKGNTRFYPIEVKVLDTVLDNGNPTDSRFMLKYKIK